MQHKVSVHNSDLHWLSQGRFYCANFEKRLHFITFGNLPGIVHIILIMEKHYHQWQRLSWYQSCLTTYLEQSVLIAISFLVSLCRHEPLRTSLCLLVRDPPLHLQIENYIILYVVFHLFLRYIGISSLYWWLSLHVLNECIFSAKNAGLLWNEVRLYFIVLRTLPRVFHHLEKWAQW